MEAPHLNACTRKTFFFSFFWFFPKNSWSKVVSWSVVCWLLCSMIVQMRFLIFDFFFFFFFSLVKDLFFSLLLFKSRVFLFIRCCWESSVEKHLCDQKKTKERERERERERLFCLLITSERDCSLVYCYQCRRRRNETLLCSVCWRLTLTTVRWTVTPSVSGRRCPPAFTTLPTTTLSGRCSTLCTSQTRSVPCEDSKYCSCSIDGSVSDRSCQSRCCETSNVRFVCFCVFCFCLFLFRIHRSQTLLRAVFVQGLDETAQRSELMVTLGSLLSYVSPVIGRWKACSPRERPLQVLDWSPNEIAGEWENTNRYLLLLLFFFKKIYIYFFFLCLIFLSCSDESVHSLFSDALLWAGRKRGQESMQACQRSDAQIQRHFSFCHFVCAVGSPFSVSHRQCHLGGEALARRGGAAAAFAEPPHGLRRASWLGQASGVFFFFFFFFLCLSHLPSIFFINRSFVFFLVWKKVDRLAWLWKSLNRKQIAARKDLNDMFDQTNRMEKAQEFYSRAIAEQNPCVPIIFWYVQKAVLLQETPLFRPDQSLNEDRIIASGNIFNDMIKAQQTPWANRLCFGCSFLSFFSLFMSYFQVQTSGCSWWGGVVLPEFGTRSAFDIRWRGSIQTVGRSQGANFFVLVALVSLLIGKTQDSPASGGLTTRSRSSSTSSASSSPTTMKELRPSGSLLPPKKGGEVSKSSSRYSSPLSSGKNSRQSSPPSSVDESL